MLQLWKILSSISPVSYNMEDPLSIWSGTGTLLDSWIKFYIFSLQLRKLHPSVQWPLPWLLRILWIYSLRYKYIWLGKANVITWICFHVVDVLCLFLCGCCVIFFNFKLNIRRTEQTWALSDDSFSWLFWDVQAPNHWLWFLFPSALQKFMWWKYVSMADSNHKIYNYWISVILPWYKC